MVFAENVQRLDRKQDAATFISDNFSVSLLVFVQLAFGYSVRAGSLVLNAGYRDHL
jgi:hypothetical protein